MLARDSFGKKPLYYWSDARRFVFGSEIKALLAAGVPAEMADEHLAEYLAFGYVPTPATFFKGIRKLPPASLMVVDAQRAFGPACRTGTLRTPGGGSARRSRLGGGGARARAAPDAGAQAAASPTSPWASFSPAASTPARWPRSWPGSCPGASRRSSSASRAMPTSTSARTRRRSRATSGPSTTSRVVAPHAAELLETLLHHHDEPFGDSSALPTYLVAREARREVTVALNGDGGDEVFAGYDKFWAALLAEPHSGTAARAPARGRARAARRAPTITAGSSGCAASRTRRRGPKWSASRAGACSSTCPRSTRSARRRGDGDVLASYREALGRCEGRSLLSRLLYLNARTYLLDDLLPKMDRMAMAHGLETRSPFLDRALAEYVATLPDALKRAGRHGKVVLKKAVEGLLPSAILQRKKHGFGVPLGAWFRGELRPLVEDTLLDGPALGRAAGPRRIRRMFDEHVAGRADRGHQLWTLLTLELWMRKHGFP